MQGSLPVNLNWRVPIAQGTELVAGAQPETAGFVARHLSHAGRELNLVGGHYANDKPAVNAK
jgi:hypothetical protein